MDWSEYENEEMRGDSVAVHIDDKVYWPVYGEDVQKVTDWYEWQEGAPLKEVSHRVHETHEHCEECRASDQWSMEFWRDNGEALCLKCAKEAWDED